MRSSQAIARFIAQWSFNIGLWAVALWTFGFVLKSLALQILRTANFAEAPLMLCLSVIPLVLTFGSVIGIILYSVESLFSVEGSSR